MGPRISFTLKRITLPANGKVVQSFVFVFVHFKVTLLSSSAYQIKDQKFKDQSSYRVHRTYVKLEMPVVPRVSQWGQLFRHKVRCFLGGLSSRSHLFLPLPTEMEPLQDEGRRLAGPKVLEKGNLGPRTWAEAMNKWKSLHGRKLQSDDCHCIPYTQ